MKVTSIMNLMKKSRCIELSELSGKQWISNGEAAYAIHCLPPLDKDQLCSIAGITEKAPLSALPGLKDELEEE